MMLEVQNLHFSYDSNPVLADLSITFQNHKIHGLLGANGAGKTTLFDLIFGIIRSQKGIIRFDGHSPQSAQVGYLETENYFYPFMKGSEYLNLLAYQHRGFKISKWNNIFQLPLDGIIDTYSTGMKKKLALFGLLALNRPLMLLDEPFNGLDLEAVENLSLILQRLKKTPKNIIIASHILPVLKKNCDRISFLHHGKIWQDFAKPDFNQIDDVLQNKLMQDSKTTIDEIFNKKKNNKKKRLSAARKPPG